VDGAAVGETGEVEADESLYVHDVEPHGGAALCGQGDAGMEVAGAEVAVGAVVGVEVKGGHG